MYINKIKKLYWPTSLHLGRGKKNPSFYPHFVKMGGKYHTLRTYKGRLEFVSLSGSRVKMVKNRHLLGPLYRAYLDQKVLPY